MQAQGTYRTFDEVQETLSPREQRFERTRRTAGLFLGPVLGLAVFFLTSGLDDPGQRLAGILTFVIGYWISEVIPIPVTAMLAMCLVVLPGVVALVTGGEGAFYDALTERLDEGVVAVLAASLLFVLPVDWSNRKFTISWNDAARID